MIAETQVLILAATGLVFAIVSMGILGKKEEHKKGKPPVTPVTLDNIVDNLPDYAGKHPYDSEHRSPNQVTEPEYHLSDTEYFSGIREVVLKDIQEHPEKYNLNPDSPDYQTQVKTVSIDLTRTFLKRYKKHHDNIQNP